MSEIIDTFFARDRRSWREWLDANHATCASVWLVQLKKHVDEPCVAYQDAVEEALCFGWIDGRLRRIDNRSHMIRFSPRKAGSTWAKSNKARVERLVSADLMTEAGMAVVRAAQKSGAWDAESAKRLDETPADLGAALAVAPAAAERWQTWAPSHRRQYVDWIVTAKRPQTRARRVTEVVRRAAAGLKPGAPD